MTDSHSGGQAAGIDEWITPGVAIGALLKAGRGPDAARVAVFGGLQAGSFIGRASRITAEYALDKNTEHLDHAVPIDIWQFCPLPPFGHRFWSHGDILISPPPFLGERITIQGQTYKTPFGHLPPAITILGLRIPVLGVIELGGIFDRPAERGRRKGAGGFAQCDGPLIEEMRQLLQEGSATSVHAAAVQVTPKARGGGQPDSITSRLSRRYREAFPEAP
ncbi:hypothetical protein [Allosphingosinicella sp.]|jgi:hypothetical protein|uniref:hypothetical protein n=1 Tax=Allosphingosinicella sp. TaxID=2823234 RepID=UPI002F1B1467